MNDNELVAIIIVSFFITLCFYIWSVSRRTTNRNIRYHNRVLYGLQGTYMKESKTMEKIQ
jgi:hypothetical protein